MRVVAILQARMGSTRLPGKVMLPLAGKSMVQNIVERVGRAKRIHDVVVAIPRRDQGSFVLSGCALYSHDGWENDLVGRYLACADSLCADIIVRVPCDNPVVDPYYIDCAVQEYLAQPVIFYSNTTAMSTLDRPFNGDYKIFVDGLGAEVFSRSRLKWLHGRTIDNAEYREHPHKIFFDQGCVSLPKADIRLDVNTGQDYDLINSIYQHFGHNEFTTQQVVNCPPVQERLHGR